MTSTANIPETELFEKALEVLNAAPASSFTTATTNDNDSKKLADDAVQVYVSFYSTSDQLALVDSQNGTTWKRQWDGLCSVSHAIITLESCARSLTYPSHWQRYRELLEDTKVLAREGSDYIASSLRLESSQRRRSLTTVYPQTSSFKLRAGLIRPLVGCLPMQSFLRTLFR